jgi:hypothetical protein
MRQSSELAVSVSPTDLSTVSQLIRMRLPSSAAEARRVTRMRRLVLLASELTRTLHTYSRHALVHCQGTAGTSDLEADTEALARALGEFSAEVSAVVREYGHVARVPERESA